MAVYNCKLQDLLMELDFRPMKKGSVTYLQLTTLIEQRARGDINEVFKIFHGLCNYGKNLFKFSRSGMKIVLTKSANSVGYWNRIYQIMLK